MECKRRGRGARPCQMHRAIRKQLGYARFYPRSDFITSSLSFASEIIFELLSDNRQLKVGQAEKEVLKSIMIARLHKELLEENQNVFVLYPTSYYRILALWQSDKILGEKEIATNYVYNQLSKDVHSLPKLLITYATFELVP